MRHDFMGKARFRHLRQLRHSADAPSPFWVHVAGDSNGYLMYRTLLLLFATNLSAVKRTTGDSLEYTSSGMDLSDHGEVSEVRQEPERHFRLRLTFQKAHFLCPQRPFPEHGVLTKRRTKRELLEETCRQLCSGCFEAAAGVAAGAAPAAGAFPDVMIINGGL